MSPAVVPAAAGLVQALLQPLDDIATGVGWLCIACTAFWAAAIGWTALTVRRGNRRGQVGDDTIAMLRGTPSDGEIDAMISEYERRHGRG